MVLTDTHTHIYYEQNEQALHEQMARCLAQQVTRLFLPNVDADSIDSLLRLVDNYPQAYPMLGLHPCCVQNDYLQQLESLYRYTNNKRQFYAVGEMGIDLYHDKTFFQQQIQAFEIQLNWAEQLHLPIVIHCRNAFEEVYRVLSKRRGRLRGIFHCFSGTQEQAQRIIDLGLYIGIGGVLTYKNSGLAEVIEAIDLQHIVLETDAPYLSPSPHRGKANESSFLIYIAQKLAEVKKVSLEEVALITTQNSQIIFGV